VIGLKGDRTEMSSLTRPGRSVHLVGEEHTHISGRFRHQFTVNDSLETPDPS